MNKKGFSSLYVMMVLSSLVFLILVLIEGAAGFAVRSRIEGICALAGESVLSEYQPSLWERYGVFALRSSGERLTALAGFYIGENMATEGDDILGMTQTACRADSQEYPGLDGERFARQLRAAAAILVVEDLLFQKESAALCDSVGKALTLSDTLKKDSEQEIREIEEAAQSMKQGPGDGDSAGPEEEKARLRDLLKRFRSSGEGEDTGLSWTKAVPEGSFSEDLPTKLLGLPGQRSLLLRAALPQAEALLENEYVVEKCSCATRLLENSYLDLEVEYILFGLPSDEKNYQETRSSLFWLRSALNLSHIYTDTQKKSQVTALAASALAVVPLPAAVFMIAGIWAGVESQNDLELLFSGKSVPFVKEPGDWACSLEGAVGQHAFAVSGHEPDGGAGSYRDYLRLLLLMVSPEKKRARLMDVMQLNIAGLAGEPFCFRDYAYGFTLQAEFQKKVHLPGYPASGRRRGTVCQEHVYK